MDVVPNISSVAARRAEAVDGSMMGCPCYSTASVVGRDTGRVDWISSMRRFIHRATAVGSDEDLALGGWTYRLGSAFRATAAAAARAWLVVEGAVEAFGNGYVGTGVDTAFHF